MVSSAYSSTFLGLVAWLYYLSSLLLAVFTLFIARARRRRGHQHAWLHRTQLRRTFLLLTLSLLLWQLTLFLEVRTAWPAAQLWLGRLNFTAIVFAPYLAWRFVQEVALMQEASPPEVPRQEVLSRDLLQMSRWDFTSWTFWLHVETGLLAALTLFTPLVDAAEHVQDGQAITTFGPLFPCYLLHVVGYLVTALVVALRERRRVNNRMVRSQLTLISIGMLSTGGAALITNALLPYGWGDFRWCDIGALSTVCFVLTVAYATLVHRLFEPRVLVRVALVHGILLV